MTSEVFRIPEKEPFTLKDDNKILKLSVDSITDHFNDFITACFDENGKPKAPSMRDLMVAKACLPARCSMAHKKADK